MLELMRSLDERFRLDLMLIPGVPGYLESLKAAAAADARIRFREPVPMRDLVRFVRGHGQRERR